MPNKEEGVPMKVMSFDIEASSSHGDFPVARKTYKKTIGEVIQYWTQHKKQITKMDTSEQQELFINLMLERSFNKRNEDLMRSLNCTF